MSTIAHPPRAYYAGAEPPELTAPRSHGAAFYVALVAFFLGGLALVGFLLSHASSEPQVPPPTVATDMPREVTPLHQTPPATQAPERTPAAAADPYDVWQATKPADAPNLSRDDAMARAMLGCGTTWPPGTTDAILQAAYAATMCKS